MFHLLWRKHNKNIDLLLFWMFEEHTQKNDSKAKQFSVFFHVILKKKVWQNRFKIYMLNSRIVEQTNDLRGLKFNDHSTCFE